MPGVPQNSCSMFSYESDQDLVFCMVSLKSDCFVLSHVVRNKIAFCDPCPSLLRFAPTMPERGIQTITIPETGFHRLEAVGAAGGSDLESGDMGGLGARAAGQARKSSVCHVHPWPCMRDLDLIVCEMQAR